MRRLRSVSTLRRRATKEQRRSAKLGRDPARAEAARRDAENCSGRSIANSIPTGTDIPGSATCYREWEKRLSPTMRQTHMAGEKMFVDYTGTKLQVIAPTTGEILTAELFVAVLGAVLAHLCGSDLDAIAS